MATPGTIPWYALPGGKPPNNNISTTFSNVVEQPVTAQPGGILRQKTTGTPDKFAGYTNEEIGATDEQQQRMVREGNAMLNSNLSPEQYQANYDDRMAAAMAGMADPATGDPLPGWYEKKQTGGNTAPDDGDLMDNTLWKAATPVGSDNSTPPWQPVTYNASDVIKDTFVNDIGREDGPTDDGLGYWLTHANANGWDADTLRQAIINAADKKEVVKPDDPIYFSGIQPVGYVAPQGSNVYETSEYNRPNEYRPSEADLVEGRTAGILNKDSALMQLAAQRGLATAQSRGLGNSSLAITSAQKAVMDQALPIAQQDSQSLINAGMAGYEGDIQGALKSQDYISNKGLKSLEGEIQGALSEQDYYKSANLKNIQGEIDKALSAQGYDQNLGIISAQTAATKDLSTLEHLQDLDLQDAKYKNEGELSAQQFRQNLGLSEKDFQEALGLSDQDYQQLAKLSFQDFREATQLSNQDLQKALALSQNDFQQAVAMSDKTFNQNYILTSLQEKYANMRNDADNNLQKIITEANLSSSETTALASNINALGQLYYDAIFQVNANYDLDPTQKAIAINDLLTAYQTASDSAAAIYGRQLTWSEPEVEPEVETA